MSPEQRISAGLPPPAFMDMRGETAIICASCPDRSSAEVWAYGRGYKVDHGLCPACSYRKYGIAGPLLPVERDGQEDGES